MAENTKNYQLTKPHPTDFYDIDVQNGNMDIIDGELDRHAQELNRLNEIKKTSEVMASDNGVKSNITFAVDLGDGLQHINFRNLLGLLFSGSLSSTGPINIDANANMINFNGSTHAYMSFNVDGTRRAWIGFGDINSQYLIIKNEYTGKQLSLGPDGSLRYTGEADFDEIRLGQKKIKCIGDIVYPDDIGPLGPWGATGLNGKQWADHRSISLSPGTWIIDCGYVAAEAGKHLDYEVSGVNGIRLGGALYCPDNFDHVSSASAVVRLTNETILKLRAWTSDGMTKVRSHYLRATKLID